LVSVPQLAWPAPCDDMKRHSNASLAGILKGSHTLKSLKNQVK